MFRRHPSAITLHEHVGALGARLLAFDTTQHTRKSAYSHASSGRERLAPSPQHVHMPWGLATPGGKAPRGAPSPPTAARSVHAPSPSETKRRWCEPVGGEAVAQLSSKTSLRGAPAGRPRLSDQSLGFSDQQINPRMLKNNRSGGNVNRVFQRGL